MVYSRGRCLQSAPYLGGKNRHPLHTHSPNLPTFANYTSFSTTPHRQSRPPKKQRQARRLTEIERSPISPENINRLVRKTAVIQEKQVSDSWHRLKKARESHNKCPEEIRLLEAQMEHKKAQHEAKNRKWDFFMPRLPDIRRWQQSQETPSPAEMISFVEETVQGIGHVLEARTRAFVTRRKVARLTVLSLSPQVGLWKRVVGVWTFACYCVWYVVGQAWHWKFRLCFRHVLAFLRSW
jgi:hypothetical protein